MTPALRDRLARLWQAVVKLQVIWDVVSGGLWWLRCEAGQQNDGTSPAMDERPPAGSLSIFDLGYFALDRFRRWQNAGAHWISRGISDLLVWTDGQSHDLHEWLKTQPPGVIDHGTEVGAARLPCRIIAFRAPADVAARRRNAWHKAAKKGRRPTARHLATCDWTVFLTSCPESLLMWQRPAWPADDPNPAPSNYSPIQNCSTITLNLMRMGPARTWLTRRPCRTG